VLPLQKFHSSGQGVPRDALSLLDGERMGSRLHLDVRPEADRLGVDHRPAASGIPGIAVLD
jgi:hypothetical protein